MVTFRYSKKKKKKKKKKKTSVEEPDSGTVYFIFRIALVGFTKYRILPKYFEVSSIFIYISIYFILLNSIRKYAPLRHTFIKYK